MILVGVDPGNVTGVAVWWDPDIFDNAERGGRAIETAEVEDSTKVVSVIKRMLDGNRPNLIVIERFTQNPRKTHQPAASEVTGAVRSLAEELHVRCVYQSPSPAKRLGTTTLLKTLGWWSPSPDDHENSACRHVLLGMATFMPERFAQLVGI
jgi:hypothetical protein